MTPTRVWHDAWHEAQGNDEEAEEAVKHAQRPPPPIRAPHPEGAGIRRRGGKEEKGQEGEAEAGERQEERRQNPTPRGGEALGGEPGARAGRGTHSRPAQEGGRERAAEAACVWAALKGGQPEGGWCHPREWGAA